MKHRLLQFALILLFWLGVFQIKSVQAFVVPGLTAEGTLTNGAFFGINPQFGDINGDGYQDLVISNITCSTYRGCVYVYFGNGTSFSSSADLTITGEADWDQFGGGDFGVSLSIGNVNDDAYDDILVGAYQNTEGGGSGAGKIYVFYGSTSLFGIKVASEADLSVLGNLTDKKMFGIAVKILDLNNDEKNDLLIVAPTSLIATSSKIYIYLNSNDTFNLSVPSHIITTTGTSNFGMSGVVSGDFNGDSNVDILVTRNFGSGKFNLFIGDGLGAFTQTSEFVQTVGADFAGRWGSISVADINTDGKDDFCIGAYRDSTVDQYRGRVYCWFGKSAYESSYNNSDADIILNGQATKDNFGRTTYLQDVTGDGKPDLLVGAYQADQIAGSRNGKFYIYRNVNGTFADSPWLSDIKTSGNTAYGASLLVLDWNYNDWANISVTQGGSGAGGTGDGVINYYEIAHGNPSTSLVGIDMEANPEILTGTASDSNTDYSISGVEWSSSNTTNGSWIACTPTDGSFNSGSEDFSCDFSSLTDGASRKIYVRTHDQNNLYMPTTLYENTGNFILDRAAPTGSVSINADDPYATSPNSMLTVTATDTTTSVTDMKISEDNTFAGVSWESYATSKAFTLSSGDGAKTVYVKFMDAIGNESDIYSDTIALDTSLPTGTISINSGAAYTNNASATLALSATDVTTSVMNAMFSEVADFSGATWEAYASSNVFTLTGADGTKTIYAKFKDAAGNISEVVSDGIILDTTAPKTAITDIGLIDNVPDKTSLFYYFTSQTPQIKGTTEANSTVHFKYDGNDYTTTANSTGNYEIDVPELPRQYVELTYYAVDPAGNQGTAKLLKLVIGIENFPVELLPQDETVIPSGTPAEGTVIPTPSEAPTETMQVFGIQITDQNGTVLENTVVYIDGQKYVTDKNGKIFIEKKPTSDMTLEVEINGKKVKATVLGDRIVAEEVAKDVPTSRMPTWLTVLFWMLAVTGVGYGIVRFVKIVGKN